MVRASSPPRLVGGATRARLCKRSGRAPRRAPAVGEVLRHAGECLCDELLAPHKRERGGRCRAGVDTRGGSHWCVHGGGGGGPRVVLVYRVPSPRSIPSGTQQHLTLLQKTRCWGLFAKARTLTNLMLEVTKSTEPGRALLQTFNSEPSYNSLNALATHAQKAYLDSAPARLTGKKRGRLEETHFITAAGWAPKIRRL